MIIFMLKFLEFLLWRFCQIQSGFYGRYKANSLVPKSGAYSVVMAGALSSADLFSAAG